MIFINTIYVQTERSLPKLNENQQQQPVKLNRSISADIEGQKKRKIFSIKVFDDFTSAVPNEDSEFDNCFLLNAIVNTTQEQDSKTPELFLQRFI